jgi:ribose 5-phosphate isomerase A
VVNMKWDKHLLAGLEWSSEIVNYHNKLAVAKALSGMVRDRDVIGFGSGSTSFLAVREIAKRIHDEHISITAIPTSREICFACTQLGIPTASLNEERPDWSFDGADEIDGSNNLIKGRGGAMFQEKLVIKSSPKNYILADETKFVDRLGSQFPVPVEVHPSALIYVKKELTGLGAETISLRPAKCKDGPVITENGNFIVDVKFAEIHNELENEIKSISGVIESGLFIGYDLEIMRVN